MRSVADTNRKAERLLFFFNATSTTAIYTLSLHDALPILQAKAMINTTSCNHRSLFQCAEPGRGFACVQENHARAPRSEEHTSELQSPDHLVCRLLLEKNKHVSTVDKWTAVISRQPLHQRA